MKNEKTYPPAELRACEICGAVVQKADLKLDYAWTLKMDYSWTASRVCENCRVHVPAREVERLLREVALRGVPFS